MSGRVQESVGEKPYASNAKQSRKAQGLQTFAKNIQAKLC